MYYISEEGDEVIGYTWDIFKVENGKLVRIGSFFGEGHADRFLAAINWYETMEDGLVSIPQKKKAKPIQVIFTPAKKTKTRK